MIPSRISLFVAGACLSLPLVAPAAAPALDPKVQSILQALSQTLTSAKSIEVKGRRTVDAGFFKGYEVDASSTFIASVLRPGFIRSSMDGAHPIDLVSDGKNISWFAPADNAYGVLKSAPTIDGAVDILKTKTSLSFPVAELLTNNVLSRTLNKETASTYVAAEKGSDHVKLETANSTIALVVDQKTHLLHRLSVTAKDVKGQPRLQIEFTDWNLNAKLAAEDFVFHTPAGADRIDPPK